MSIINSLKRALGFPGDFDGDEDLEEGDLNDEDLIDDPDPEPDGAAASEGPDIDLTAEDAQLHDVSDEEIRSIAEGMFDSVLAYFNSHQPEMVRRCIDIDAQRKLIIENVDADIRTRILALADKACRSGQYRWAEKQQRLGAELMKLKSEYNTARQQREEYQSAQLSAARQQRALTDRVHSLEAQVTQLEAEREQYQLENKSMATRLRSISEGEQTAMAPQQPAVPDAAMAEQIEALKAELSAARREAAEGRERIAELTAIVEENSAPEGITLTPEQLEDYHEMESRASELRRLKDKSEARVIELTKELRSTEATVEQLQKQLSQAAKKAEATSEEMELLRTQLEDAKSAKTANVANMANIAKTAEEAPAPRKRKKKSRRRNEASVIAGFETETAAPVKISAIDELMEDTDWFVAPDPVPLKKDPEVEENFGYKEPEKKDRKPDDRQLTLF